MVVPQNQQIGAEESGHRGLEEYVTLINPEYGGVIVACKVKGGQSVGSRRHR